MKKLLLLFALCTIFSPVCPAETPTRKCLEKPVVTPRKKAPAIFRPFVYLFNKVTGKVEPMARPFTNMECLELSKVEIFAGSPADSQIIDVTGTPDQSRDPTDTFTVNYTVTGGKIIGQGRKVVWDLSGVRPGVYMITAAADDGCGVCGMTITLQARVLE